MSSLLAGGVFTRQAEVTFQPGGEKLTITQEFKGIDEHDHLVVSTRLEGRIPEVPAGASIQIDPYEEIYQYASNRESDVTARVMKSFQTCIIYTNIVYKYINIYIVQLQGR